VAGGGLTQDGYWVKARRDYLVPVKALSVIFRAVFLKMARKALPDVKVPEVPWNKSWWIDCRPTVQGTERVLQYLARYLHKAAFSNRRLVRIENGKVTFRYQKCGQRHWRLMTLPAHEFIRRFLQHVLPKGMHKVRYYGLWNPANRELLRRAQLLLGTSQLPDAMHDEPSKSWDVTADGPIVQQKICPRCQHGKLVLIEIIPRQPRAPPWSASAITNPITWNSLSTESDHHASTRLYEKRTWLALRTPLPWPGLPHLVEPSFKHSTPPSPQQAGQAVSRDRTPRAETPRQTVSWFRPTRVFLRRDLNHQLIPSRYHPRHHWMIEWCGRVAKTLICYFRMRWQAGCGRIGASGALRETKDLWHSIDESSEWGHQQVRYSNDVTLQPVPDSRVRMRRHRSCCRQGRWRIRAFRCHLWGTTQLHPGDGAGHNVCGNNVVATWSSTLFVWQDEVRRIRVCWANDGILRRYMVRESLPAVWPTLQVERKRCRRKCCGRVDDSVHEGVALGAMGTRSRQTANRRLNGTCLTMEPTLRTQAIRNACSRTLLPFVSSTHTHTRAYQESTEISERDDQQVVVESRRRERPTKRR